jgi:predicted MPP superfamily phosphohydrolase
MKKSFILFSLLSYISLIVNGQTKAPTTSLSLEKDAFHFFVIGDWGRNGDYHQREVAEAMRKTAKLSDPEFIISTGDNFYTNGVASTQDPLWRVSYEDIYTGMDLNVNWFPVLGNHDYHGNAQAQIDYSQVSRRWNFPSRYYTFTEETEDKKTLRFVFIDTNPFVEKYRKSGGKYGDLLQQDTTRQLHWLDSVLSVSDSEVKIVVGHHPVYSSSPKHGNTPEMIRTLKPRLEKYKVHAYFCGHDHDLQHQKPEGFVDYFLSGAGSEVRETGTFPFTKFAKSNPGFALVSVTGDVFTLYYIGIKGEVLYKYTRKI